LVVAVSCAPPGAGWLALSQQSIHLILGIVAFVGAYSIPVERIKASAKGALLLVWLLLILMLFTSLGEVSNASERWLRIGSFRFQPSVLYQFFWLIALAHWAANDPMRLRQGWHILRLSLVYLLLLIPVFLQPDLGSTVILFVVSAVTLLYAGVPTRFLKYVGPVLMTLVGLGLLLFPHVSSRFSLLNPGFQVQRSMEAFALGGLTGRGPGMGVLKHGWLPEGETDFVFALIAEEWGLLGNLVVLGLFVAFTLYGMRVARRAETRYGAILMASAVVLISLQAAYNMGMVTGILPVKGLPLPFISRGGTSILVLGGLIGAALRASFERRQSKVPTEELIPWTESTAPGSSR
jgi:cell division protein FtsW